LWRKQRRQNRKKGRRALGQQKIKKGKKVGGATLESEEETEEEVRERPQAEPGHWIDRRGDWMVTQTRGTGSQLKARKREILGHHHCKTGGKMDTHPRHTVERPKNGPQK